MVWNYVFPTFIIVCLGSVLGVILYTFVKVVREDISPFGIKSNPDGNKCCKCGTKRSVEKYGLHGEYMCTHCAMIESGEEICRLVDEICDKDKTNESVS